MERNARLILVSTFVVLTLVILLAFYQWIQGPDTAGVQAELPIQFDGSVSGLSIGSDVRYLGVPVGRVTSINLSRDYPGRVDVEFGSDQPLPSAEKLVALLEAQGITGLSIIELRDRSSESPGFEVPHGYIPGYPSLFSQLAGSASRITDSVESTLSRLDQLLSDQAAADLEVTISQLRTLSSNLVTATADMDQLMASASRASEELAQALPSIRSAAEQLDAEVLPTITEAGRSVQAATEGIATSIGENGEELSQLIEKDLPTMVGITDELALSLQQLNELLSNINSEPGALLYGRKVKEVEISSE